LEAECLANCRACRPYVPPKQSARHASIRSASRSDRGSQESIMQPKMKLAHLNRSMWMQGLAQKLDDDLKWESLPLMPLLKPRILRLAHWFDSLEEPARNDCLATFVDGSAFALVAFVCTGLNACLIMYTTDCDMQSRGEHLPGVTAVVVAEVSFVLFYVIELLLKLMVHRLYFFWGGNMGWNMFDAVLVAFSVVEASFLIAVGNGNGANVSFLRVLRLCKIAKVLRLFRALRFFTDLRLLIDCVLASSVNLMCCCGMILFFLFMFALLIMQALAQTMHSEDGTLIDCNGTDCVGGDGLENLDAIRNNFGSVVRTVLTLMQCTTGGKDWEEVYNLLAPRGWVLPLFFVFYILFWVIVAENIVTSAFVEKAFRLARPDSELLVFEQQMQDCEDANNLRETVLNGLGEDTKASFRDRGISLIDFEALISNTEFHSAMRLRGIDINNAKLLYKMLRTCGESDKEQDPDIKTFVNACLRMKGAATSVDMHSLSFEQKVIAQRQLNIAKESQERLNRLESMVSRLLGADASL